jgi:hypothetical protein
MSAPLATRRAVRPDGQHYRRTRRHAPLRRHGRSGLRGAVPLAAALLLAWWAWHGHGSLWTHAIGYGGAAIFMMMALAGPLLARR